MLTAGHSKVTTQGQAHLTTHMMHEIVTWTAFAEYIGASPGSLFACRRNITQCDFIDGSAIMLLNVVAALPANTPLPTTVEAAQGPWAQSPSQIATEQSWEVDFLDTVLSGNGGGEPAVTEGLDDPYSPAGAEPEPVHDMFAGLGQPAAAPQAAPQPVSFVQQNLTQNSTLGGDPSAILRLFEEQQHQAARLIEALAARPPHIKEEPAAPRATAEKPYGGGLVRFQG